MLWEDKGQVWPPTEGTRSVSFVMGTKRRVAAARRDEQPLNLKRITNTQEPFPKIKTCRNQREATFIKKKLKKQKKPTHIWFFSQVSA